MYEEWFWLIALIAVLVLTVVVGLIAETVGSSSSSSNQALNLQKPGLAGERCEASVCSPGYTCGTGFNNERICLGLQGSVCRNSNDCLSGLCQNGICVARNGTSQPPPPPPPSQGSTNIYCWNGSSWVLRYTLPQGLTPIRITTYNGNLLAITNDGQVFYYDSSTGAWKNLTNTFTPPGQLIDGLVTSNGSIYLVYRLPSGQYVIYQLVNGSLITVTTVIVNGQPIEVTEIDVATNGTIYIVGRYNNVSTIYIKTPQSSTFTASATGQNVFVTNNGYAFSSGSSILVVSPNGNRVDNTGEVIDFVVDNNDTVWYISSGRLFRQGSQVTSPPVPINSSTRLFWSSTTGLCLFTPGY